MEEAPLNGCPVDIPAPVPACRWFVSEGRQWLGRPAVRRRVLSVQSVRTGAYCKARERLPAAMVTRLLQATRHERRG